MLPYRSKRWTLAITALLVISLGACGAGEEDPAGAGGSNDSGGSNGSGGSTNSGGATETGGSMNSGGAAAGGTDGSGTGAASTGAVSGVGGGSGGAEAHPWSCGPGMFWLAPCSGTPPIGTGGQTPASPTCQSIPERCESDLSCDCICSGWLGCDIESSSLQCGCA